MKKFTGFLLALVMCLSLCIPAFAATQNDDKVETVEVNGATVQIFLGPDDMVLTRGSLPPISGTATSSSAPITFAFDIDEGNFSDVRVWNEDDGDTEMKVTFNITIRNSGKTDTMTKTEQVAPGERTYVQVTSNDGSGLNGNVKTTLRPVGESSVDYLYLADQRWK